MERVGLTMNVHGVTLELAWEKTLTVSTVLEHSERLDQVILTISVQHRTEFAQTPVLTVAIADQEVTERVRASVDYQPQQVLPPAMLYRPQNATRKLVIRLDEQPILHGQALALAEDGKVEIFLEEYGGNPRVSVSAL